MPTAAELRLLQVLWERGEATVDSILEAHAPEDRPHYKTTQSLLRIMEGKGFIAHETRGRVFIFRPVVSREEVNRQSIEKLVKGNFGGSAAGLLVNLLETTQVEEKELVEIESLIQECRQKRRLGKVEKEGKHAPQP